MSIKDETTELRLQLFNNGYTPLPNQDKKCLMRGWSKVAIDEKVINTWSRMNNASATGLRVENGLCVIDIDIDHRIIEDVCEAMLAVLPEKFSPHRLERTGKGLKLAWFCRTDDLFSRLHTRRWIAPGDTVDDGTHSVEIFGGGSSRQFGAFGPHTVNERGQTVIAYDWHDESPQHIPLNALDVIPKDLLSKMLDAAEQQLKLKGFTPVTLTKKGESIPKRVYDLNESMRFKLADGDTVKFSVLQNMVKRGYTGRCSASWLEGPSAVNLSRCLISKSGTGNVSIWESASGITHMPEAIKPVEHKDLIDKIYNKIKKKQDIQSTTLEDTDDYVSCAAKLLHSYAYMPTSKTPIVPLWSNFEGDSMTLANFKTQMLPYCSIEIGPRGGERKIHPVDVWLANSKRIIVAGQRMRPDCDRPIFKEHGVFWINIYRPPDLGAIDDGDPQCGIDLIKQLVPDKRERTWFLQWLAYKWKHPYVPGPSIIMVAREFGTGRGTFGALLKLLFGDRYVVNVPFKIFAGQSYQSQYTDWGLDALFAIVNESSASGDMSAYKAKHDVYEHLKEVVEPRPVERTYIRKGEGHVRATASASSIIMTNNPDALPIPENDRRFAVLTNGSIRKSSFWVHVNEWMAKRSNIAAFASWLEQIDLKGYDPYEQPLSTLAKEEMSDFNKSPLDRLLMEAVASMNGFFVPEQVIKYMSEKEFKSRLELPKNWKTISYSKLRKVAYIVRYSNGQRVRPQISGVRFEVFHKDQNIALSFDRASDVRQLLMCNGNVF